MKPTFPATPAAALEVSSIKRVIFDLLPGVCLCGVIAAGAMALRDMSGIAALSPMIVSAAIGVALRNVRLVPIKARDGISFSMKRILRLAIILLGLQLTVQQSISMGVIGLAIVATVLAATFLFTIWLGRLIGVDHRLAELIAAGTSICGASAIVATNIVTKTSEDNVVYAVASVTVFGSISILAYPVIGLLLGLDRHTYGLWSGTSIHEIAQVVAAVFPFGEESGQFAMIAKLSRVAMLVPVITILGVFAHRRATTEDVVAAKRLPKPWFILGFIVMIVLNSTFAIAPDVKSLIAQFTAFLLALALAAMGLETDFRKLYAKGLRPLALGAASWIFIATLSLGLIELLT